MPLGLIQGIGRAFRRKRTSSLDILTSKNSPRGFYKGKNCKPTGFHTRKGGYVVVPEKLPNYVVPDLSGFKIVVHQKLYFTQNEYKLEHIPRNLDDYVEFDTIKLKPYVSQCAPQVADSAK